ncbi:MAG: 3-dehydroquinate dehydratase [Paludibacteraceae bacterium]|nr:3-dehydroquinate dehydratase [Paludibacteraceae bacterium]
MQIAIINGPNLNLLGKRDPQVYGSQTMEQTLVEIQRQWLGTQFVYYQSNHEGALIDRLQAIVSEGNYDGVVINAGGYAHTSVALRDAVEYVVQAGIPVVNVHISDIRTREAFRQIDLLTDVSAHTIIGHGINGYKEAVEYITALKS